MARAEAANDGARATPRTPAAAVTRKVILLGEHAVVYGHPALAAGLSVGIAATARARQRAAARARPGASRRRPATTAPVGRALAAIVRRLEAPRAGLRRRRRRCRRARAWAARRRWRSRWRARRRRRAGARRTTSAIDAAVAEAEAIFHGNPSGIDAAAAKSGGAGRFTRAGGLAAGAGAARRSGCASGCPAGRATPPRRSRRSRACAIGWPVADDILATLGKLADEAARRAGQGRRRRPGTDVRRRARPAVPRCASRRPSWTRWSTRARAAGAIGAKLTGAGGGGAVIALAPGHERDVLARWKAAGFDGFMAEIAATPRPTS